MMPGKAAFTLMRRKTAFTLVELLVVISILGVLVAILVPSLKRAREAGKRTACAASLRQVGVALFAYLETNNQRLPHASLMPSISSAPLDDLEDEDAIRIADVLKPFAGEQVQVFRCPGDAPGWHNRDAPNQGRSYYQSEGSSYEYRVRQSVMGHTILEAVEIYKRFTQDPVPENTIWLMRDYNNFHAKGGEQGSRRYLYIDGHVADFEKF